MASPTWKRFLPPAMLWIAVVLFFSTRTEVRGETVWTPITWSQALQISLAQWSVWGLLALMIVWVDRRLPIAHERLVERLLFHVPLCLIFTVAYTYMSQANLILLGLPRETSLLSGGFLATSWRAVHRLTPFLYWVIVGAYLMADHQSRLKDRLVRTAELEKLLSEARFNVLRSQLQPHFLFNALNAVSAHVEADPKIARQMIERLGDLLRSSLDHLDQQEIRLDEELAFVEKYLQLQAMRFEDRFDVCMNVDRAVHDALVPPFILQPLVENAIRHGVSKRSAHGTIMVDAKGVADCIHLTVRDNGPGLPPEWSLEQNAGIGSSNTRERLRFMYGEANQSLRFSRPPGGGVCVDLRVPIRSR